jgi:N-acetylglutamate synthase-like GNAT family acetyltransferase
MLRPGVLRVSTREPLGPPAEQHLRDTARAAVDGGNCSIRPALQTDLAAIERLLEANRLPTAGVAASLETFLVARDRGTLIGAIGLEMFGDTALLRSAVVERGSRSEGCGSELVREVMSLAGRLGVRRLYLLTTTAEMYFPRFGFTRADRDSAPSCIRDSVEFREACPASAALMLLTLPEGAR